LARNGSQERNRKAGSQESRKRPVKVTFANYRKRGRHFAIVRSYLKAAKLRHGLLMNFADSTLHVKRVISQHH